MGTFEIFKTFDSGTKNHFSKPMEFELNETGVAELEDIPDMVQCESQWAGQFGADAGVSPASGGAEIEGWLLPRLKFASKITPAIPRLGMTDSSRAIELTNRSIK